MSFLWVVLVIVVSLIIVFVGTSKNTKKRIEKQDSYIKREESKGIILSNKTDIENGILAIDKPRKMLVYIDDKTQTNIVKKEFPFSDIISCELIKDGQIIYKKSITRTVGGAIAGGVIAGGVGSIIGGLSGSSTQKEKIKSIELKINLRNIDEPSFKFKFFKYQGTRIFLERNMKLAEEWKDRISAIIDMNENGI